MPTTAVGNDGVEDPRPAMRKRVAFKDVGEEGGKGSLKNSCNNQSISCSDGSSSIGRNSDVSENTMEESGDGDEVQSSLKCPFDAAMEALEEVLPIRRGISRFYNGKSKSFTSLADVDASSSSTKHLAKPDNAYMRRRRNLLACSLTWDKNRSSCPRSNGGGISKRVTGSSRATLALAVALNDPDTERQAAGQCSSAGSGVVASPMKEFSSWRSYSLADLQRCVSVGKCRDSDQLVTKPC